MSDARALTDGTPVVAARQGVADSHLRGAVRFPAAAAEPAAMEADEARPSASAADAVRVAERPLARQRDEPRAPMARQVSLRPPARRPMSAARLPVRRASPSARVVGQRAERVSSAAGPLALWASVPRCAAAVWAVQRVQAPVPSVVRASAAAGPPRLVQALVEVQAAQRPVRAPGAVFRRRRLAPAAVAAELAPRPQVALVQAAPAPARPVRREQAKRAVGEERQLPQASRFSRAAAAAAMAQPVSPAPLSWRVPRPFCLSPPESRQTCRRSAAECCARVRDARRTAARRLPRWCSTRF